MNAIVALPTLTVAPRARLARKGSVAKPAARAAPVAVAAQKQESSSVAVASESRAVNLAALSAASALALASPAHAGDLFSAEYSGLLGGFSLGIGLGVGGVSALLLPIICGTLNPVQMAINLGVVEGEVSNLRKFKNNGEPMEHGTKFGHKWYNTDAYCNGKYIDFAGTKKTMSAMEKSK